MLWSNKRENDWRYENFKMVKSLFKVKNTSIQYTINWRTQIFHSFFFFSVFNFALQWVSTNVCFNFFFLLCFYLIFSSSMKLTSNLPISYFIGILKFHRILCVLQKFLFSVFFFFLKNHLASTANGIREIPCKFVERLSRIIC